MAAGGGTEGLQTQPNPTRPIPSHPALSRLGTAGNGWEQLGTARQGSAGPLLTCSMASRDLGVLLRGSAAGCVPLRSAAPGGRACRAEPSRAGLSRAGLSRAKPGCVLCTNFLASSSSSSSSAGFRSCERGPEEAGIPPPNPARLRPAQPRCAGRQRPVEELGGEGGKKGVWGCREGRGDGEGGF